jgi:hypothetical protein
MFTGQSDRLLKDTGNAFFLVAGFGNVVEAM